MIAAAALSKGYMEKQEMEMKWKLETVTGNWRRKWKQKWKCNLLAGVLPERFAAFVHRHPRALLASSF